MSTRSMRWALGLVATMSLVTAGCEPARDRFAELEGPLVENVLFPDELDVDVSNLGPEVRELVDAVSPTRLRAHVRAIDVPRPRNSPGAGAAAVYIDRMLTDDGYSVTGQNVTVDGATMPNIIATKRGVVCPGKVFVLGAHYDSVPNTPGADDDASGVAGMLEVAQVLRNMPLPITVKFVGFAFEETGLQGSAVMAQDLRERDVDVVGMVSLEMIGFSDSGIDPFIGTKKNYLAMVGDDASAHLAKVFGAAALEYLASFFAPASVIDPADFGDILRSDHASFWRQGYQALLLTDTANFRNPNYHQPSDTFESLDFTYMRGAVRATTAGLLALATVDADGNGRPDVCG